MEQTGLSRFSGGGGGDRPLEEAAAVAGNPDPTVSDRVTATEVDFPPISKTIDLGVIQVNYSIDGSGAEETPIIHVFGRTEDGRPEHVRVHGFRPYFYAPTETLDEAKLADERITDTDPGYRSIRGESLTKIYARTPRDVGTIREEFDHYEADILFPNRFLIDIGINSGVTTPARRGEDGTIDAHYTELEPTDFTVRPRVHMVDIEVDDRSGFPQDGEEPIICLFSHDSVLDEYVGWIFESPDQEVPPPSTLDGYEPLSPGANVEIRTFTSEPAMLADYLTYVEETDPDCFSGWNVDDFDAPYLLDRLDRLNGITDYDLSIERLSRIDEVWRSDWQGPNIKGRIVFDLLYAYQRTQFSELDSYRLDAVGEQELGVGKERYTGDIGDLWELDPKRLLEYNLRDVELCIEIDRKQDIIDFWNEVRTFVGCKLEDATTPGDAVDMFVLHKVHGQFALPSKGQFEGEDYEGGAVFDPITGVRENVSVLDLRSLYPMCMVTINASPETKVDPEAYEGETYRAPNGTRFRKEPDGIIRAMVDELLAEREEKKDTRNRHDPDSADYERYDRQQAAVKVIMNCFTPDTEVVTPEGVRNIRDLEVGDEVYSLDPDTMRLEVQPVVETHAYPAYRGELIDIQTGDIDFRVTPNHRMLVRKTDATGCTDDEWSFVEAGDLQEYCHYEMPHGWDGPAGRELEEVDLTRVVDGGYEVWVRPGISNRTFVKELGWRPPKVVQNEFGGTGFVLTKAEYEDRRTYIDSVCDRSAIRRDADRTWIPRTYPGDDFLEFIAWYTTDGTIESSMENQLDDSSTESSPAVMLKQDVAAATDGGDGVHSTIGALLDGMGFNYSIEDRRYQSSSKLVGDLIRDLCGGTIDEKRIPDIVFEASHRQQRRFLETLVDGNGQRKASSMRFTTQSKRLRDDVLRLCLHLGRTAKYDRDGGAWHIDCSEDRRNSFRMDRDGARCTAEDGVYCVTVADNHTLFAGRNGRFQHVSQSLYGVLGWDRFRLYDKEMGAAITATGREVIRFTQQQANSIGYDVVYGDTDSVMLELGPGVEIDDAIDQSFDIERAINESYDEFAESKLDADSHRFEIEFEKLYRRFFQAGKKKRYAGYVVWKEGKSVDDIDITGFEYKRSDIAPITKEVQRSVIEMIVTGTDLEDVKAYVRNVIEDFQDGDVDLEDVGIPGGIGKRLDNYDTDTAHVRGAKYANLLLGTNFNRGSKPKRLYLRKVHPEFFRTIEAERNLDPHHDPIYSEFKRNPDVICFEYADQIPDEFEIDWEKMLEKTLKGPISRVLEAVDISWEELKSGQEQTGLGSFM